LKANIYNRYHQRSIQKIQFWFVSFRAGFSWWEAWGPWWEAWAQWRIWDFRKRLAIELQGFKN